jgi:hypothetical protein
MKRRSATGEVEFNPEPPRHRNGNYPRHPQIRPGLAWERLHKLTQRC